MKIISVIGLRGFPGVQGGVENHCEKLYPRFSEQVKVRVYRRKPYLTSFSDIKYPNIEFIDLPSTRIKGLEAVLHTFLCCVHIMFHRPDVVHVHNIGPGMFIPLLKLMGLRVCMTYHSPNYEHKKWGMIARMILKMSESLSLDFADNVIFVNKFQLQKYSDKRRQKSFYVPNGMEQVVPSDSTTFLQKWNIERDNYILGVGRLTPEKGFDVLIKAANAVSQVKNIVIAGASDHDAAYFEYLKQLDINHKVIFTGFTTGEDLRQLYSHAQLFVLSSINEGFPLVLLEAMGYGLPLVVSDIPATHLLSLPESDYATCNDSEAFSKKIAEHISAKEGVEERVHYDLTVFDWAKIAEETQSILIEE